jgi:hypothetical protein
MSNKNEGNVAKLYEIHELATFILEDQSYHEIVNQHRVFHSEGEAKNAMIRLLESALAKVDSFGVLDRYATVHINNHRYPRGKSYRRLPKICEKIILETGIASYSFNIHLNDESSNNGDQYNFTLSGILTRLIDGVSNKLICDIDGGYDKLLSQGPEGTVRHVPNPDRIHQVPMKQKSLVFKKIERICGFDSCLPKKPMRPKLENSVEFAKKHCQITNSIYPIARYAGSIEYIDIAKIRIVKFTAIDRTVTTVTNITGQTLSDL